MLTKKLPVTASTIEIIDCLGSNPGYLVQTCEDHRTLTYKRINDQRGFIKAVRVLETGEEFSAKY